VRAKHAGIGRGRRQWQRARSVRFGEKCGPLSRHRGDGTLLVLRPIFLANKIKHNLVLSWRSHSAIVRGLCIVRQ